MKPIAAILAMFVVVTIVVMPSNKVSHFLNLYSTVDLAHVQARKNEVTIQAVTDEVQQLRSELAELRDVVSRVLGPHSMKPLPTSSENGWDVGAVAHRSLSAVTPGYTGLYLHDNMSEIALGQALDVRIKRTGAGKMNIHAREITTHGIIKTASIEASNLFPYMLLPPNMIDNSFMHKLNGDKPAGFSRSTYKGGGVINIQAVHPYTKCFEGPYCNLPEGGCTQNQAETCNEATESKPYIFGRYYKGSRASRGGLADGWAGQRDGKILKISGKRDCSDDHNQVRVNFPIEGRILTRKVLFRGFLKIIKGKASLQTDVSSRPRWTREQTEAAQDGWLSIHELIAGSHITDLDNQHVFSFNCYGEATGHFGDFEMYLALPYMANIVEKSDSTTSAHWQESIVDNLIGRNVLKWSGDEISLNVLN